MYAQPFFVEFSLFLSGGLNKKLVCDSIIALNRFFYKIMYISNFTRIPKKPLLVSFNSEDFQIELLLSFIITNISQN